MATGCVARVADRPPEYTRAGHWKRVQPFPVVVQSKSNECAAAVAFMISNHWGKALRSSLTPKDAKRGISAAELEKALKQSGLEVFTISGRIADLEDEIAAGRPVIVGTTSANSRWRYGHYKIVVGVDQESKRLLLVDPMVGYVVQSYAEFDSSWQPTARVALVAEPLL